MPAKPFRPFYTIALSLGLLAACSSDQSTLIGSLQKQIADLTAQQQQNQAQISGVVKDLNGVPIMGVRVKINDAQTATDEEGFYQLRSLATGEVKILLSRSGYTPLSETLQLEAKAQVRDFVITPSATASPTPPQASPSPTSSPTPIFLPPDGSSPSPPVSPSASPSAAPSPSPSASASPTPSPTPTPLYDPLIDQSTTSDLLVKRHPNGLQLTFFLLKNPTAAPLLWKWGTVKIRYSMATSDESKNPPQPGGFITSGATVIMENGEAFVAPVAQNVLNNLDTAIFVDYTLELPNKTELKRQARFAIN